MSGELKRTLLAWKGACGVQLAPLAGVCALLTSESRDRPDAGDLFSQNFGLVNKVGNTEFGTDCLAVRVLGLLAPLISLTELPRANLEGTDCDPEALVNGTV